MKTRHRDLDGNLFYKCWNCKSEFNFKAMRYLSEQKGLSCPTCNKKIKLIN